jgi:hypothetical protein
MVAGMALDPRDTVNDAPALLSRPVPSQSPLPPLRDEPGVAAMHEAWARAHDADHSSGTGEGLRGSLRTRAESAMSAVAGPTQRRDRAVVGSVIQAVDAVARRCDELAGRVAELEAVVGEVVDVLGADLVRVRAELARRSVDDTTTTDASGPAAGAGKSAGTNTRERRRRDG